MANDSDETPYIRPAVASDAGPVLAMMDGIMDWLVSQGRTAQWGTAHWSATPALVDSIDGRIARGELRVAVGNGGDIAGGISLSRSPGPYIQPADEPELFINYLATSRRYQGRNIGGALLGEARAEARRRGLGLLRVDCFAGDDGRLKDWYAGQGFEEVGPFTVRREGRPDWPGMLFALRLG
ncbi:GNAT family N-acetyltransferase [Streptomyces iconiensis]|uniref:GNAT family N-acetyltransferase n=1 Tax=Streptomyces iconiensis TaxID=1384038 RepID=A0ABT6ZRL3_9ACTN|nr:GNAT family N-acetyltransferase [Streptomyces iconiensis]MDJ1131276.1 GNAT family N-acetyltransferase [Streptomyces iconiensis]